MALMIDLQFAPPVLKVLAETKQVIFTMPFAPHVLRLQRLYRHTLSFKISFNVSWLLATTFHYFSNKKKIYLLDVYVIFFFCYCIFIYK